MAEIADPAVEESSEGAIDRGKGFKLLVQYYFEYERDWYLFHIDRVNCFLRCSACTGDNWEKVGFN